MIKERGHCLNCKKHQDELATFRQEVSDAVEQYWASLSGAFVAKPPPYMARFIIAKPDPLAQAWLEAWPGTPEENAIAETGLLLAAIEKRGGRLVWGEG